MFFTKKHKEKYNIVELLSDKRRNILYRDLNKKALRKALKTLLEEAPGKKLFIEKYYVGI